MPDELEWKYEEENRLEPHWFTWLSNDKFNAYLSVSLYKANWHFYASTKEIEGDIHASWMHGDNIEGWPDREAAMTAAVEYGLTMIDPDHVRWYDAFDAGSGTDYRAAHYKPINAWLSVFQATDEMSEPVDEYWHFQIYVHTPGTTFDEDITVVSVDHTDEEFTDRATAERACQEAAIQLRDLIEKKQARAKAKADRERAERERKERIEKARAEANIDIKYDPLKSSLFD